MTGNTFCIITKLISSSYKEKKELSKKYFVDRILVENAAVSSPLR